MGHENFIQPDSCEIDGGYYIKSNEKRSGAKCQKVRFLCYRPHPAEVLIHDGDKPRVIHRNILYAKKSDEGKRK